MQQLLCIEIDQPSNTLTDPGPKLNMVSGQIKKKEKKKGITEQIEQTKSADTLAIPDYKE